MLSLGFYAVPSVLLDNAIYSELEMHSNGPLNLPLFNCANELSFGCQIRQSIAGSYSVDDSAPSISLVSFCLISAWKDGESLIKYS